MVDMLLSPMWFNEVIILPLAGEVVPCWNASPVLFSLHYLAQDSNMQSSPLGGQHNPNRRSGGLGNVQHISHCQNSNICQECMIRYKKTCLIFLWFLELHMAHCVADLVGERWITSKWRPPWNHSVPSIYLYAPLLNICCIVKSLPFTFLIWALLQLLLKPTENFRLQDRAHKRLILLAGTKSFYLTSAKLSQMLEDRACPYQGDALQCLTWVWISPLSLCLWWNCVCAVNLCRAKDEIRNPIFQLLE